MEKQLLVTVNPDGTIQIEAMGYGGSPECEVEINRLVEILGHGGLGLEDIRTASKADVKDLTEKQETKDDDFPYWNSWEAWIRSRGPLMRETGGVINLQEWERVKDVRSDDLPFPLDLLVETTEKGSECLANIYNEDAFWKKEFYHLNYLFLVDGRTDAQEIVKKMKKAIPPGVPFRPIFLMLAHAFVAENLKSDYIERARDWRKIPEQDKDLGRTLRKVIKVLSGVENNDPGDGPLTLSLQHRIGTWLKRDYPTFLKELEEEIKRHRKILRVKNIDFNLLKTSVGDAPKSFNEAQYSPETLKAFNEVTQLLGEHGQIKRGVRQLTQDLFGYWGIIISPEAGRVFAYRRRKEGAEKKA